MRLRRHHNNKGYRQIKLGKTKILIDKLNKEFFMEGHIKPMEKFEKELEKLINKHSIENECDMPDFLLAKMIVGFIKSVGEPIKETLDWHGCDSICHPKPKDA